MNYIVAVVLFFVFLLGYFQVAKKYKIIDVPNSRSSHKGVVIRGGGIIFVFGFLYSIFNLDPLPWPLIIGFLLIAIVSFVDDIYDLSTKIRMLAQFIAVILMTYHLGLFNTLPYFIPIICILFVATINAYNFMDGINGINGLFSLSVLFSLAWMNHSVSFIADNTIWYLLIAILVFGFFNFRKKAKCFSGDVGSVSIAFALIFLISSLVIATKDFSFILFLLFYGIETFWTVVQRALRGDKITEAHRLHLFQLLSNEMKIPHLAVSIYYFLLQSLVSFIIIWNYNVQFVDHLYLSILLVVVTSLVYLMVKIKLMKKLNL